MQTWACTKCGREISGIATKCQTCSRDKPGGLSEEERAAIAMVNAGRAAREDNEIIDEAGWRSWTQVTRNGVLAQYRAARSPLEAENAKLRAAVKDLERQRDNATQATAASAERAERLREAYAREQHETIERGKQLAKLRERVRELEDHSKYQHTRLGEADRAAEEAEKSAEFWKDFHDMEKGQHHAWVTWAREHGAIATGPDAEPEARKMLEAQLAQAQKPAAPAGLPEVGSTIRRTSFQPKLMKVSEHIADDHCRHKFRTEGGAEFWMEDEGKNWERIAPAQTSQEPSPHVADAVPYSCKPSASPPGEAPVVTTANFTRFADAFYDAVQNNREYTLDEDPTYNSYNFHRVVKADIRANVERETNRDKARIAELEREVSEWRRADLVHMQERDAALAEVERLKVELAKTRSVAGIMTDAGLGEAIWQVILEPAMKDPFDRDGQFAAAGKRARELFAAKANEGKAKP